MKKKFYIGFLITCGILVFVLLYILISVTFNNVYGHKIKDDEVIKLFNANQEKFDAVIKEIDSIEIICIRKQYNSYYELCIENNDKKFIDIKQDVDDYLNYKKSIDIMEELNISYISKNYNNISFTMNSMFGLGQQIVYISDMAKYKYGNSISYIKNIENNWYYIETK